MRKLFSLLVLSLTSLPAFAEANNVPEPETLALLAVGFAGMLLAKRKK